MFTHGGFGRRKGGRALSGPLGQPAHPGTHALRSLFGGGGAGGDPLVVGAVGGAAEPARGADFLFGAGAGPFADFGVAIGEGKAAGTVVEAGGEVAPLGIWVRVDEEVAVVDAVGVFVEEGVDLGGVRDGAEAEVLAVAAEMGVIAGTGGVFGPGRVDAEEGVEGDAADAVGEAALFLDGGEVIVGRAFVELVGAAGVFGEEALFDEEGVGVVGVGGGGGAPGHDVVAPVLEFAGGFGSVAAFESFLLAEVIDAAVVVVAGVELPGEAELFGVAHAEDAMGFCLGFGKGREKHAGEDGDDGNDDEEFDEGEAVRAGRGINAIAGKGRASGLDSHKETFGGGVSRRFANVGERGREIRIKIKSRLRGRGLGWHCGEFWGRNCI